MSQDNHTSPTPYIPFITAVKSLVFHTICQFDTFIPLGPVLVNQTNGNVLHIEPSLLPFGDLIFKIYHQSSNLFKLSHTFNSISTSTKQNPHQIPAKVLLAPIGVHASLVSFIKPPKSVKAFSNLLMCSYGVKIDDSKLLLMEWASFNLSPSPANSMIISWPIDFCFYQPASKPRNDNDLFWFRSNDIISQVEAHMNDLQNILFVEDDYVNTNTDEKFSDANDINSDAQESNDTTGKSARNSFSTEYTSGLPIVFPETAFHLLHSHNHMAQQPPMRPSGSAPSMIYPTPPDPTLKLRSDTAEHDQLANDSTPGKSANNWGDIGEDLFGDEQEITEDDFNFFDDRKPEDTFDQKSEVRIPSGPDPELPENKPLISQDNGYDQHNNTGPSNQYPSSSSSLWSATFSNPAKHQQLNAAFSNGVNLTSLVEVGQESNVFSPLKFHSALSRQLDSKYSRGGRYFVEPDNLDMEEGDDKDSEESEAEESPSQDKAQSNKLDPSKGYDENRLVKSEQHETPGDAVSSLKRKFDDTDSRAEDDDIVSKNMATGWFNLLSQSCITGRITPSIFLHDPEIKTSDSLIFDLTIEELIHQIIWDDGYFSTLAPRPLAPQYHEDKPLLENLRTLFPNIEQLSLLQVLRLSEKSVSLPLSKSNSNNTASPQINSPDPLHRAETISQSNSARDTALGNDLQAANILQQQQQQQSTPFFPEHLEQTSSSGFELFNLGDAPKLINTPSSSSSFDGVAKIMVPFASPVAPEMASTSSNNGNGTPEPGNSVKPQHPNVEFSFHIDAPHYTMIRMNQMLKAKSPILRFWKVFGLEPNYGKKSLAVLMMCPGGKNSYKESSYFLQVLKSTYEGSGLGEMTFLKSKAALDGILPISYQGPNLDHALEAMKQAVTSLGRELKGDPQKPKTFTLLIVNPFSTVSSLVAFSQAFAQLKKDYFIDDDTESSLNIVLKIIPVSVFASTNTLNMPSQYRMVRLALDLYERCPIAGETPTEALVPVSKSFKTQRRCPAFTLSRMPPSRISFQYSTKPSPSILEEDCFLHIAYSVSENRKWLVTSWSDQFGEISKVEAFCLMKAEGQIRVLEEVTSEIWQKTLLLVSHIPVHWKISIAKLGPIEEDEVNVWKSFASSSSKVVSSLYILSVNTKPSLVIRSKMSMFPHLNTASPGDDNNKTKPTATNDSLDMFSFNNSLSPSTNSASAQREADRNEGDDTSIIDTKNDIYGVLFKYDSFAVTSFLTALKTRTQVVTGYLLKPDEASTDQDIFEATLVHCTAAPYESMKSILIQYRHLASLGASTGVENRAGSTAPWHICAIDKAQRVLSQIV